MAEVRSIENFFLSLALVFISAVLAPYLVSLFEIFIMENVDRIGCSGGIFGSMASFLCKFFKVTGSFLVGGIALFAWNFGITANDIWFGLPLHKQICRVAWPEDLTASNTKTITVMFVTLKGTPIDHPGREHQLVAEVYRDDIIKVDGTSVCESSSSSETGISDSVNIIFNARTAGTYTVYLKANGFVVRGFPTVNVIVAGPANPEATTFLGVRSQTLVLTVGTNDTLRLDPRDQFGNSVSTNELDILSSRVAVSVFRILDKAEVGQDRTLVYRNTDSMDNELSISFAFTDGEKGWYKALVTLDGQKIGSPPLTLLVLDRSERSRVDAFLYANRFVELSSTNYFEGDILSVNGLACDKPRKAFCYLNSKQLSLREYIFRVVPRRSINFRIAPATKVKLKTCQDKLTVLTIEDSFQSKIDFRLVDGNIMAACFHLILLRKIGGSESFTDKQAFFYIQLVQYHRSKNHRHSRLILKIERFNLLESSLRATRNLNDSNWCQLFQIEFEGEPGIDQGGLRREWFEIIAAKLFSPSFGLFVPLEEGGHAVLPNRYPPPIAKKYNLYKFAGRIVGKCLYESSQGLVYRQYVPVRLAKSFLAQLVGLRVHYRHFADDAPEFYASKIRLIETTSVDIEGSGLDDLTFSEEEGHDLTTGLARLVNLKPNGSSIKVTDENKLEYLDLLSQYRLNTSIKEQTEQFLEGLHSLVPDSLLAMFDENELELLICGVRDYKLSELKAHHTIIANGLSTRTISWFWLALEHFTQEQFAKLMQFTTGSSQLPTGGFESLRPLFQIASSGTYARLPTAHTCFNMICLPEHNNFSEFEKALLTAISEGSEGFGFA